MLNQMGDTSRHGGNSEHKQAWSGAQVRTKRGHCGADALAAQLPVWSAPTTTVSSTVWPSCDSTWMR